MAYDAPDYQHVLWDNGRPYWLTASGKKTFIPPLVAAQMRDNPEAMAWAAKQGVKIDYQTDPETGQVTVGPGGVENHAAPGGSLFHERGQWNSETGEWDRPINWSNIMAMGVGGAMAAPFIVPAIAGAAGAGGGAGAGAATTGAVLPSTVIAPTMAALPAGLASGSSAAALGLGGSLAGAGAAGAVGGAAAGGGAGAGAGGAAAGEVAGEVAGAGAGAGGAAAGETAAVIPVSGEVAGAGAGAGGAGAAGAGAGGAGAGAGAGGAAAGEAAVLPSTQLAPLAGALPAGATSGTSAALAGATLPSGAGAGAGTMSTLGKVAKIGQAAGDIGTAVSNASSAAGTGRRSEAQINQTAQRVYEQALMDRAKMEMDQRRNAARDVYRSNFFRTEEKGPYSAKAQPKITPELAASLTDLERQGITRLQKDPGYDTTTYKPLVEREVPEAGKLEKAGSWIGPTLSTIGAISKYFRK